MRAASPRKASTFERLGGAETTVSPPDAVDTYLRRCNHVRVAVKACVVRSGVPYESKKLATLPRDQLVVVCEERLLGDERRVRISAPVKGWVSRRCLAVTADLLNERNLRTLVCVSGDDLPLFDAWLVFYRKHHTRDRELHAAFYDDESYLALLKLQEDDDLNVVLHDTVIFPNTYERQEAQKRREKLRCLQWAVQSAPNGVPVVYSSLEAFWIKDPLPDLLRHRRRTPPMLDDIRPQGRPFLAFSIEYGELYEGDDHWELCSGFCCIWNCAAARQFMGEWRHRVDFVASDKLPLPESMDQLQINAMYDSWKVRPRVRPHAIAATRRWRSCPHRPPRKSARAWNSTTKDTSAACGARRPGRCR